MSESAENEYLRGYLPFVTSAELDALSPPMRIALRNLIGEVRRVREDHAAEERRAWDEYAATNAPAACATRTDDYTAERRAADFADRMLEQRRQRFPNGPAGAR